MRAVGFDLGETLIFYRGVGLSWEDRYPAAFGVLGETCGIPMNESKIEQARNVLRKYNTRVTPRIEEVRCEDVFKEIYATWGLPCDEVPYAAIQSFFKYFQDQADVYSDTVKTLTSLRLLGVKVGVLTDVPYGMNSTLVIEDLKRAGIDDLVDVLLTSVDVGMRKPHAKGFEMLAQRLDSKPNELIYVGNERKDIEGANGANAISVLIDRDGKDSKFGQQKVIRNLEEVLDLVPQSRC